MTQDTADKGLVMSAVAVVNRELADPGAVRSLIATVFKDFDEQLLRKACTEIAMRGYDFKDILDKKIYAIKYGTGYSLVQSINDVRAIAMRSGQIGKSAPQFEVDAAGKPISCSVTVKRAHGGEIGEYTSLVFFKEYTTGKNQWATKPMTMIAKVAEMHALRSAFPEELSLAYVEEEYEQQKPDRFGGVVLPDPKATTAEVEIEVIPEPATSMTTAEAIIGKRAELKQ